MTEYAQQPCERKTKETDLERGSKSVPIYALVQGSPTTPDERYVIARTWRQVRQGPPIPEPPATPPPPEP
jgi:hypothetical protein